MSAGNNLSIQGDDYIRAIAAYIRSNEKRLVDGATEGRFIDPGSPTISHLSPLSYVSSIWNVPKSWISSETSQSKSLQVPSSQKRLNTKSSSSSLATKLRSQAGQSLNSPAKPFSPRKHVSSIVLTLDPQHLLYLLTRFDELGVDVGPLDLRLDLANKPPTYISFLSAKDPLETASISSISSFRTMSSAMSNLSFLSSWSPWSTEQPTGLSTKVLIDNDIKYTYSAFTKIPGLRLVHHTSYDNSLFRPVKGFEAFPLDTVLSLVPFKNLSYLEISNLSVKMFYGWDVLADQLVSLITRNAGINDIAELFVHTVIDDMGRRKAHATRAEFDDDADFGIDRLSNKRSESNNGEGHRNSTRLNGFLLPSSPILSPRQSRNRSRSGSLAHWPSVYDVELPDGKWNRLGYLNLSDNELTFISTEPMVYLTSLSHLDLANNLLINVPSALSYLPMLVSLNLSNNMIESLIGVYTAIPNVKVLNLSHNRLENICGLERVLTLERVDLRDNHIGEAAEIGRLSGLLGISNVWVSDNPFTKLEPDYRIKIFNMFKLEDHDVLIDGSEPTYGEKRYIVGKCSEVASLSVPVVNNNEINGTGHLAIVSPTANTNTFGRKKGKVTAKRIVELDQKQQQQQQQEVLNNTNDDDEQKELSKGTQVEKGSLEESIIPKQRIHRLAELESKLLNKPKEEEQQRILENHLNQDQVKRTNDILIMDNKVDKIGSGSPNLGSPLYGRSKSPVSVKSNMISSNSSEFQKQLGDGEAYKKRLEAIKSEAGSAWLRIVAGEMMQQNI